MASAARKRVGRPYKDCLTPFLHRNFVQAALITLLVCYVEAAWFAGPMDFWSWFPFGLQSVRTSLLFVSSLAVFILRVAGMHGRLLPSPESYRSNVSTVGQRDVTNKSSTAQTFFWYIFSAWFFCEVYVWSQPESLRLATVDQGRSHERPKLNERLVFLRFMFIFAGVCQGAYHIHCDKDRLELDVAKDAARDGGSSVAARFGQSPLHLIKTQLVSGFNGTVQRTIVVGGAGLVVYLAVGRPYAWQLSLALARPVFNLPKNHSPTAFPAFIGDLIGRFAIESFMLNALWQVINTTFTVYVSQPPVKNSMPLTTGSKDPNGSLIAGLKAKKLITRTFAFFELALIATLYSDRRVLIYRDIDRSDGSAWTQIYAIGLSELHALVKRIQDFQHPPTDFKKIDQGPVNQLPKISDVSTQSNDKIFTAPVPHKGAGAGLGDFAKSHGQSPDRSLTLPQAQQYITQKANAFMAKSNAAASKQTHPEKATGVAAHARALGVQFLRSQFGEPLRSTFDRRVNAIMFGAAGSNISIVSDSILAMTNFAVNSLAQDTYGRVASDVPTILRTYTSTITTIESFRDAVAPHWTDVYFVEGPHGTRSQCKVINDLLDSLRRGLRDLIVRFEPYHETINLSIGEIRRAKQAARLHEPNV